MFFSDMCRPYDDVKDDQYEREDNQADIERHRPFRDVAREERLDKSCHEEHRHSSEEDVKPLFGILFKSLFATHSAWVNPSCAEHESCGDGDNDGADFYRAVQPHRLHGFGEYAMLVEESAETAEHHTVVERHDTRAEKRQYAHDEAPERHHDVVGGYLCHHRAFVAAAVHIHRRALADVLQAHLHIFVAENESAEVGVAQLGNHANERAENEQQNGIEKHTTMRIKRHRYFLHYESSEYLPCAGVAFLVNRKVNLERHVVQVGSNLRVGIVGLRESKVCHQLVVNVGKL